MTSNVSVPNPESGEIEHDAFRWAPIDEIKDIDNSENSDLFIGESFRIIQKGVKTHDFCGKIWKLPQLWHAAGR